MEIHTLLPDALGLIALGLVPTMTPLLPLAPVAAFIGGLLGYGMMM